MAKRFKIQVRQVAPGYSLFDSNAPYTVVETIERVLYAEQCGNFNPVFCSYKNCHRTLVHSEHGDISDPFRRDDTYLTSLYIRVSAAPENSFRK